MNAACIERADAPHPARRRDRSVLASTVRERNEAGADAAALECGRIHELEHLADEDCGDDRHSDPEDVAGVLAS
jgi:hypothetical protein